jgi:hypothetical protein
MEGMINGSFEYLDSVTAAAASCLTTNHLDLADGGFQFNISECSSFTTEDLNAKVNFANELKALKTRTLEAQASRVKLTVAAMEKYKANCSRDSGFSSLDVNVVCPAGAPVSPTAEKLISDVLGMAVMRTETSDENAIKTICESATQIDETFCETYYPSSEPATPNVTDRPAPPSGSSPYIEAPNQRDPSREAFIDGLSGIGWGIVNQLTQRPQPYNPYQNFNPYPYYGNPYSIGMLSPADQVLFNARYYGGYGYYSPTLGAAPYTAFPMISPYVQAAYSGSGNSSPYFTSFGTYK